MLRAGTLNDERVIRKVSANFVPTHFNNNDPSRDPSSPSAKLWKSIKDQKVLQGQGLWIVSPDGKVLAGMSAEVDGHASDRTGNGPGTTWKPNDKFVQAALEMMDQSLREFGSVQPRNVKPQPLPYRGAGVKPDGGVRLVVYNRAENGLVFSVQLDKDQWQSFQPAKFDVSTQWKIPEATARLFAPVLSPYGDTRLRPRPQDLTSADLSARIEAVDNRQAKIRLTGRWVADWKHDDTEHSVGTATAEGIAIYDIERKTMRSLLMVFDGTYSYTHRPGERHKPGASSAVVRWRLEGDAE